MGCETSRNVSVDEDQTQSNKSSVDHGNFNELQIDVVKSTWPLLSRDMEDTGCKIFTTLFDLRPEVKAVFPAFSDLSGQRLRESKKFRTLAVKFMNTIGFTIERLEEPEKEATDMLMMLGAKHATMKGFDVMYFHAFNKSILQTWEGVLRQEYTIDVKEAWTAVLEFMQAKIRDGYHVYLEDHDRDEIE